MVNYVSVDWNLLGHNWVHFAYFAKKYTKTEENKKLNDLLLETLAWINYHRR